MATPRGTIAPKGGALPSGFSHANACMYPCTQLDVWILPFRFVFFVSFSFVSFRFSFRFVFRFDSFCFVVSFRFVFCFVSSSFFRFVSFCFFVSLRFFF